jgi:hypothetical protein
MGKIRYSMAKIRAPRVGGFWPSSATQSSLVAKILEIHAQSEGPT